MSSRVTGNPASFSNSCAISRKDSKWLTTLPGVGGSSADKIVAALQRKVTRFALMAEPRPDLGPAEPATAMQGDVLADAYNALLSVGHNPADARAMLDAVLASGGKVASVEDVLMMIYKQK